MTHRKPDRQQRVGIYGGRLAGTWFVVAWGIMGTGATYREAYDDLLARGKKWAERWYS